MWNHRRLLPIVLVSSLVVLQTFAAPNSEPVYQRKPLSAWLKLYKNAAADSPAEESAEQAVRSIGTNAAPHLVRMLTNEDLDIQSTAVNGFKILGPLGAPAVPALATLLAGPNALQAHLAASSLGHIGTPALPVLLAGLTNRHYRISTDAALAIAGLGTNAAPAIPILLHDLQQPDHLLRERAADTLGTLRIEPELVVPALTNVLDDPSPSARYLALSSLGRFESAARPALPIVCKLLDDQDEVIRKAATNAVRQIAPEVLSNPTAQ
jgi:HEAT repeat protein